MYWKIMEEGKGLKELIREKGGGQEQVGREVKEGLVGIVVIYSRNSFISVLWV